MSYRLSGLSQHPHPDIGPSSMCPEACDQCQPPWKFGSRVDIVRDLDGVVVLGDDLTWSQVRCFHVCNHCFLSGQWHGFSQFFAAGLCSTLCKKGSKLGPGSNPVTYDLSSASCWTGRWPVAARLLSLFQAWVVASCFCVTIESL